MNEKKKNKYKIHGRQSNRGLFGSFLITFFLSFFSRSNKILNIVIYIFFSTYLFLHLKKLKIFAFQGYTCRVFNPSASLTQDDDCNELEYQPFSILSSTLSLIKHSFHLSQVVGLTMAATSLSLTSSLHFRKTHSRISPFNFRPLFQKGTQSLKSNFSFSTLHGTPHFRPSIAIAPFSPTQTRASSDECFDPADEAERLLLSGEKPVKFAFWVIFWASLSLAWFAVSKDANAAVDSIKASGFGLKIANSLRKLGWPDGVVVFTLATLPVLELRGAIPVGYWMQLNPTTLTILSILGLVF